MGARGLTAVWEEEEAEPAADAPPDGLGRSVALLFGGHSLRDDWTPERSWLFDEVVGVNGACFTFPVDWAVMVDAPLLRRVIKGEGRPRMGVVTYASHGADLHKVNIKQVAIPSLGKNQKSYSGPRGLLWALSRAGPTGHVEIFGMDYSAEKLDVNGIRGDRGPVRWQQEAVAMQAAWDASRIAGVHGRIKPERLAFIAKRGSWPG